MTIMMRQTTSFLNGGAISLVPDDRSSLPVHTLPLVTLNGPLTELQIEKILVRQSFSPKIIESATPTRMGTWAHLQNGKKGIML